MAATSKGQVQASPARGGTDVGDSFRRTLIGARLEAGLTRAELADKLGISRSAVERLESGGVTPTVATLRRLADVLALRFEIAPHQGLTVQRLPQRGLTVADLHAQREEILRIAAKHGAANVRVFGSVARGEADAKSDVDVLIDVVREAHGFDYFGLLEDIREELEELLGRHVDVADAARLGPITERVLTEAVEI